MRKEIFVKYQRPIEVIVFFVRPSAKPTFKRTVPFTSDPRLKCYIVHSDISSVFSVGVGKFFGHSFENDLQIGFRGCQLASTRNTAFIFLSNLIILLSE